MKIFAETERLLFREILPTDIDVMFELDSDPEVHKYLGNKPVSSKEQAMDMINFIRQQYIDYGIGRWAVIEKKTNDFMGWSGLKYIVTEINGHKNYYDLGYRLIRKYWRKGIATESALASLEYAFDKLKLNEVYGMAESENIASNKILRKVGLRFIEDFDYNGMRNNWYKIERVEFESRNTRTIYKTQEGKNKLLKDA